MATQSSADQESVDRGDDHEADKQAAIDAALSDDAKGVEADDEAAKKADKEGEERARDEKGKFIPKERFDEAVQKERTEKESLAARLKEFEDKEAQNRVADDYAEAAKIGREMIAQHSKLIADGELDQASELMERILNLREQVSERKAETKAYVAKDMAKEEVKYDALVAKLEADYPQINPDGEEYDTELVANVQALMAGYMQTQKMSATKALQKAVEIVMPKAATDAASGKAAEAGVRRKEAAVTKALAAKGKQPASTGGVGIDHDKEGGPLDASAVMKMTWDEFVKLPESKLSELRGDNI